MGRKTTRRDFVKETAALSAAWWVGSQSNLLAQERSPMERVNFACIGVGGKGDSDTNDAARLGNIVALCDIDDNRLRQKANSINQSQKKSGGGEAQTFHDYREMLEKLGDKIDAVTVSTPDHHHAPASARAMRMGKHCFCQKPLTWSIEEAQFLRKLSEEKKLCTQMGNQGTSHNGLREAVEVIRSGGIGEVTEVHVWTNRPIWPQGEGRPSGGVEPPKEVLWDLFLGPAPERPYVPNVYHPFKWRGWLDFGTGALGDMACHTANMAVMALDIFDPDTVVVTETSGVIENETYPKYTVIEFQFPARKASWDSSVELPPVKFVWYDGGKKPQADLFRGEKPESSGSMLIGRKGTLYSPNDYGSAYVLLPKPQYAEYKKPEPTLPRSPGHFEEFVQAIKADDPTKAMSNFSYAGRLTETILLGNVALRLGQGEVAEWDAKNAKVKNHPQFTGGISREYREGWDLKG